MVEEIQDIQSRWNCYVLDSPLSTTLSSLKGELLLEVTLLDADKEVIVSKDINLQEGSVSLGGGSTPTQAAGRLPRAVSNPGQRRGFRGATIGGNKNQQMTLRVVSKSSLSASWLGRIGRRSERGDLLDDFSLTGEPPRSFYDSGRSQRLTARNVFAHIAPLQIGLRQRLTYAAQVPYELYLNITESELAKVKDIRCAILFRPATGGE
jgi:hypothetical protein